MVTKQDLEKMAQNFDTSKDFDAVMAYYDVLEIADKLRGRDILEMGSSAGTVTRYLLPHASRLDIVEGSKTGIERTRELLGDERINYFHECWEDFKPNEKYSDIVFVRGLEHVEEPSELLSMMKDWITDDGRIHIIVPNAHSLHRKVMFAQGELPDLYALRDRDHQVGHVQVYDKENLERDVKNSGLNVDYSSGFFVKPISTSQMGDISMSPNHPLVRACYSAGKIFPELGTQLYVVGEKK
jgi:SAM-dependent methyltransferase|tara:strand:+ start:218 stop:940 length:723 start_codon:yes stop_codon:yes gene_type:complete